MGLEKKAFPGTLLVSVRIIGLHHMFFDDRSQVGASLSKVMGPTL